MEEICYRIHRILPTEIFFIEKVLSRSVDGVGQPVPGLVVHFLFTD
jgi:hypothetical protein